MRPSGSPSTPFGLTGRTPCARAVPAAARAAARSLPRLRTREPQRARGERKHDRRLGAAGVGVAAPARRTMRRTSRPSARRRRTARSTGSALPPCVDTSTMRGECRRGRAAQLDHAAARARPGRSTPCPGSPRARRSRRTAAAAPTDASARAAASAPHERERDVGVGRQRQVRAVLLGARRPARASTPPAATLGQVRSPSALTPSAAERARTKSGGDDQVVGHEVVDRRAAEARPASRRSRRAGSRARSARRPRRWPPCPTGTARPIITARAPRASALTTSLPRRMPPSSRISTSSPTASTTAGQRADRGRRAVEVVAAVVRDRDRVGADVDRAPGVVGVHDALDHERAAPRLAQPRDVRPRSAAACPSTRRRRRRTPAPPAGRRRCSAP